jgi:hypothetical protein
LLLGPSDSLELSRQGSYPRAGGFGRVWKLELHTDDKEVEEFASWSALLLHMMIHKAFCIFYHPLFRNATSTELTGIQVREKSVYSLNVKKVQKLIMAAVL